MNSLRHESFIEAVRSLRPGPEFVSPVQLMARLAQCQNCRCRVRKWCSRIPCSVDQPGKFGCEPIASRAQKLATACPVGRWPVIQAVAAE